MTKKKMNYLFLIVAVFVSVISNVNAKSYAAAPNDFYYKYLGDGSFCFSRNTGQITCSGSNIGHEKTKYATFGGQDNSIYCAEWTKGIDSDTKHYYMYDKSKWNPTSERAIVVGYISYNLNPNNEINKNLYAKIGVALNHYLANCSSPLEGSRNFPSLLSEYSNVINKAKKYYSDNKTNMSKTTLKEPKFNQTPSLSGSTSSSGVHTYKTVNKIEISNLTKSQYGANVKFILNITSNNTNAKVSLTGKSGSYVSSISNRDITSSISSDKYSFSLYIQGTNIDNSKITITVNATNSSTYYSSYLYYSKAYGASKQRLIYPATKTVNRSSKKTMTVVVPKTNSYNLYINKIDEETGEPINGARFTLKYNGSAVNLTDDGKGTFSWESGVTTDTYDFSKFELTETKVPGGFISSKTTFSFPTVSNGKNCYKETGDDYTLVGNDAESLEYCNAHELGCTNNGNLSGNTCSYDSVVDPSLTCNTEEGYSFNSGTNMCEKVITSEVEDPNNPGTMITTSHTDQVPPGYSCNTEDGYSISPENKCVKTTTSPAVCLKSDGSGSTVDLKYCNNDSYALFTLDGKTLSIDVTNKKNTVTISKSTVTGDAEIPGAELKICKAADYNAEGSGKGFDCIPYKNVDGEDVSWISGTTPHEVRGVVAGDYAIIETIAPNGYGKISTAVLFSIDGNGKVTGKSVTKVNNSDGSSNDIVVVNNTLNKVTISKTDLATTKELPGATLSICRAVTKEEDTSDSSSTSENEEQSDDKDEYTNDKIVVNKDTGECIPVVLNDGTRAQWVSTSEPKVISGLPVGTYYLVEKISPSKYSTAEVIMFKMNEDGTVSDKDGKSLANNKLVMKDAPISSPPTGILPIIIISIFGFASLGILAYVYIFKNRKLHYVNNK